jgi:hypothetical protein
MLKRLETSSPLLAHAKEMEKKEKKRRQLLSTNVG